jgi:hypothetical protein
MTACAPPNAPATLRIRAAGIRFPEQLMPRAMAKQSIARPIDIRSKLNIFTVVKYIIATGKERPGGTRSGIFESRLSKMIDFEGSSSFKKDKFYG